MPINFTTQPISFYNVTRYDYTGKYIFCNNSKFAQAVKKDALLKKIDIKSRSYCHCNREHWNENLVTM